MLLEERATFRAVRALILAVRALDASSHARASFRLVLELGVHVARHEQPDVCSSSWPR
jgi:hypothetical protein